MKRLFEKTPKVVAVSFLLIALVLSGCAPQQSGTVKRQYDENWRFVPRIHVEDEAFGATSMEYNQCSYDQFYAGYWCSIK